MKQIILLIIIIAMFAILSADYNHNAAYIRMGVGARSLAMGSSNTAGIEDATAAYWNPAGLSRIYYPQLATMYSLSLDADRTYNYVGLAFSTHIVNFGLTWINANMTGFEGYDSNANPTGNFDNSEHNIGFSLAKNIGRLRLGTTGKLYFSDLDDDSDTLGEGFGIDFGIQYDLMKRLSIGIMGRDLYGKSADITIPYEFTGGITWNPIDQITLASDLKMIKGLDPVGALGIEYWTALKENDGSFLSKVGAGLRAGAADIGDNVSYTVGAGLGFGIFNIDYAYMLSSDDLISDSHRLSLRIDLGYNLPPPVRAPRREKIVEYEPIDEEVVEEQPIVEKPVVEEKKPEPVKEKVEIKQPEVSIIDIGNDLINRLNNQLRGSFEFDSATIKEHTYKLLDELVLFLRTNDELKIEVIGHTCNLGTPEYNQDLSNRRADFVTNYLTRNRIQRNRILASGLGETKPVAPNDTEESRMKNRRIEFRLIMK